MRKLFFGLLVFMAGWGSAHAGGFQVYLHGTKGIGMGMAGVGLTMDASTILNNPGGAAFLKRTNVYVGLNPLFAYLNLRTGGLGQDNVKVSGDNYPFNAFFSMKPKPNSRWTLGLAVYTPFGLSITYPDNWVGRFVVQKSSITTIYFQPTVSFKISEKIGIGVGPVVAYGMLGLKQALPLAFGNGTDGQIQLDANAVGFGANIGVTIKPAKIISIGINYRTPVRMNFSGTANLNRPESVSDMFPSQTSVKTGITIPDAASIGIGLYPTDKLTLALDVCYTGWQFYDTLRIDFGKNSSVFTDQVLPRNYHSSFAFRVGGQYKVNKLFTARLGVYYDMSPIPDKSLSPELPDGNLLGLTCGASLYLGKNIQIDAAFQYINVARREANLQQSNFSGSYAAQLFVPSVGVQFSFGKSGDESTPVEKAPKGEKNKEDKPKKSKSKKADAPAEN